MVGRVKVFSLGAKRVIYPFAAAAFEIILKRARVVSEVSGAIELERVNENGGDHCSCGTHRRSRCAEEAQMPFVQGSHCRDKGDGRTPVWALLAKKRGVRDGSHGNDKREGLSTCDCGHLKVSFTE